MADFKRGYSTKWRVRRVDPGTWLPGEELEGVDSISISRQTGDSAPLLESGEVEASREIAEGWYRIEALATQGGTGEAIPVATMLFTPDGSSYKAGSWSGKAVGKGVLATAAETDLPKGEYAPKGADVAEWCVSKLRGCVPAPVSSSGSFTLSEHYVFDIGSNVLDAVWKVLDAAGWCMQVDGEGAVSVMPAPAEPSFEVNEANKGLLLPDMSMAMPIGDVPNVLKAYDGSLEAEAVNDDPESPTSTVARGRRIVAVEDSPARVGGETLKAYAQRRLRELSEVYETLNWEREFERSVRPYSVVRVNLPSAGVEGDFTVMSQTLECGAGIKVGETLGRRQSWR